MKQYGPFLKFIWQASKKDLLLGLPWLPLYSLAEILLAIFAGILLQLVFLTDNTTADLSQLIPGKFKNFIHFSYTIHKQELIFILPCCLVLVAFVKLLAGFMSSYLTERAGHRVASRLRESMLKHYLLSSGNKLDSLNPDFVANQLMQDTNLLQAAISKGTISAIRDTLVLLGILVAMLMISWQTCLVGMCFLMPTALLLKKISQRLNFYTREGQKKQIGLSTRLLQSHQGILTIHGIRSQQREHTEFEELNAQNYAFMKESLFVRTFFPAAMEFFALFLLAILFAWRISYTGNFQAGSYSTVLILMAFSIRYIKNVAGQITFFSDIQVVLQRIQNYLAGFKKETKESHRPIPLAHHDAYAIKAQGIFYKTPEGKQILHNCSISIPRGKKIAFIGESGAGKTSFLRVLAGLIVPSSGTVSLDPRFLMASQSAYIFKGSIQENIVYSCDVPETKIQDQCIHLVMALSLAYSEFGAKITLDKKLGFLGEGCSGGEKARIALARTLFASPELILLDEPTANLDTNSAKLFWQAINQWMKNDTQRTLVAVSHALHEVQDFDECYLFENGRIVASGPPNALVRHA